jgi:hypothetical protein
MTTEVYTYAMRAFLGFAERVPARLMVQQSRAGRPFADVATHDLDWGWLKGTQSDPGIRGRLILVLRCLVYRR